MTDSRLDAQTAAGQEHRTEKLSKTKKHRTNSNKRTTTAAGQEHRTQKLSKTKKHRTQLFLVLEHMSAPYSQSIHPKHIPKGLVVANLAVVRAHYCHF